MVSVSACLPVMRIIDQVTSELSIDRLCQRLSGHHTVRQTVALFIVHWVDWHYESNEFFSRIGLVVAVLNRTTELQVQRSIDEKRPLQSSL